MRFFEPFERHEGDLGEIWDLRPVLKATGRERRLGIGFARFSDWKKL